MMLSTKQVAQKLSKSERTIRLWIEKGLLPAFRYGRNYEILESDLEKFIKNGRVVAHEITNKNYDLEKEINEDE